MSKQTVGIGSAANDGTGDPLRVAFNKINSNFNELYNGLGGTVAKSGAAQSHTGDTNEFVLATIPIPANALGANGVLRVTTFWTMTSSGNNKTLRIRLGGSGVGGTAIFTSAALTTIDHARCETTLIASNATNAQVTQSYYARGTDNLTNGSAASASTVDMTADQNLAITAQLGSASETIALTGYIVEIIM